MRSSKLRNKQKCIPLIRRQKFSTPVREDGMLLVMIEIRKWSERKSGNFLVGAADSDLLVQPSLGAMEAMEADTACCGT